jgi:hypothetical protein
MSHHVYKLENSLLHHNDLALLRQTVVSDTVTVIEVPGGPVKGDIVTSGLPSVVRSVVAHAEPSGMTISIVNPSKIDLLKQTKI